MASLAGLSGAFLLIKGQLPLDLQLIIDKWAAYLLVASTVGAFMAKTTTKDKGLQENELPLKRRKAKR